MDGPCDQQTWLRAARRALLRGGPGAVRVERLAADLGVTKGSFYWHFKDRQALLELLISEWERESESIEEALQHVDRDESLRVFLDQLGTVTVASEKGDAPSDAAVFAWAAVDPHIARRVDKEERRRIALFSRLVGSDDVALVLYYAFHGFVHRRRRVPNAAVDFPRLQKTALRLMTERRTPVKTRASIRRTQTS